MKHTFAILLTMLMILCAVVSACAEPVRVIALQGPTGIGMVRMMKNNNGAYDFTMTAAPDEAVAAIVSGSADIAAVPTNLAAVLYNRTAGGIRMLGLNTLGVLYILEKGNTIQNVADLAGKTVLATGQGATPEYVLNYILAANGLKESVTVEYRSEHAELATLAAAGLADIVLLPEPHVTAVLMKNPDFRIALDVTELFGQAAEQRGENALLSMGCVIANTAFIHNNPEAVEQFMSEYRESVEFVNADPEAASLLVQQFGIMPKAEAARRAIPNCHIVLIEGTEMTEKIKPFFGILYSADPKSVGGNLPGDDLYYIR